jgi:hypothetical protein
VHQLCAQRLSISFFEREQGVTPSVSAHEKVGASVTEPTLKGRPLRLHKRPAPGGQVQGRLSEAPPSGFPEKGKVATAEFVLPLPRVADPWDKLSGASMM